MLPNIIHTFAQYPALEFLDPNNGLGRIIAAHPDNQAAEEAKLFIRMLATHIISRFVLDRRLAQPVGEIISLKPARKAAAVVLLLAAPVQPLQLPAPVQPVALLPRYAASLGPLYERFSNCGDYVDRPVHKGEAVLASIKAYSPSNKLHWYNDTRWAKRKWMNACTNLGLTEDQAVELIKKPAYEFSTPDKAIKALRDAYDPIKQTKYEAEIAASTLALQAKRAAMGVSVNV